MKKLVGYALSGSVGVTGLAGVVCLVVWFNSDNGRTDNLHPVAGWVGNLGFGLVVASLILAVVSGGIRAAIDRKE